MNKKIITGLAIVIIVLGGVVWIAWSNLRTDSSITKSPDSSGILEAEEVHFDFGTISMAAGKVGHNFKIKNTGSVPIVVKKIYTSCMCTTATFMLNGHEFGPYGMRGHGFIPEINKSMGSGEQANIEVIFDPTAHGPAGIGRIEREVVVENNTGKTLNLKFTAIVAP